MGYEEYKRAREQQERREQYAKRYAGEKKAEAKKNSPDHKWRMRLEARFGPVRGSLLYYGINAVVFVAFLLMITSLFGTIGNPGPHWP